MQYRIVLELLTYKIGYFPLFTETTNTFQLAGPEDCRINNRRASLKEAKLFRT